MNSPPQQAEIGDHPSPNGTPQDITPGEPFPDQVQKKSALHSRQFEGDQNEPEPPSPSDYRDNRLSSIHESPTKRNNSKVGPSGSSANDPKPEPEDKAPILTEEVGACGYFELFNKGDRSMTVLVGLGHIFAASQGVMQGLIGLVIGDSTGDLTAENPEGLIKVVAKIALKTLFFGCGSAVAGALSKYIWTYLQNTLSHRVKFLYFSKILEKDMGWYDRKSPEKITSQYNIDSQAFQDGVSYSNGMMSYTLAMALTGLAVGLWTAPIFA
jgi:hypothetical protein